jgi:glyoxylase-like metal-dependent hydrolase (beta-lactamase superfamily II)
MPKAVQFDSYGGVDVLEVRDVPRPVPEAGEVLVEVRAAGINPSEAVIRSGARLFPGQIPGTTVTAVPAENNRLELEGHRLDIVDVGHTDADAASVLHVPDLDLVVAGDAIYNGVHLYLAESADGGRDKWRSAIDIVESLDPRWIVAGHKNKDLDEHSRALFRRHATTSIALTSCCHSRPQRWASSTPCSNATLTDSTRESSG